MARPPQLTVAARPTQVNRSLQAQAGSDLLQVSDALARFNPTLKRLSEKRRAEFAKEQSTLGTQDALEEALTFRDAVKDGSLELGRNPYFRQARKEQIGRTTGQSISAELSQAYAQWEGKDTDDPKAVQEFVQGFIAERTSDIDDADVLAGVQPALATATNNLLVSHQAYTTKRIEREYTDGLAVEISGALDQLPENGPVDPESWNATLADMKAEARLTGFPLSKFDDVVVEAVIAKAVSTTDADFLDILDVPRADGTPPISAKPAVQTKIAQARDTVLRYAWRLESEADEAEKLELETATDQVESSLINAAFLGDGISDELKLQAANTLGASKAAAMVRSIESLSSDSSNQDFEDDDTLDRANYAAYVAGDVATIRKMILADEIPPKLRATYLSAADTQAGQIISRGRAADNQTFTEQDRARRATERVAKEDEASDQEIIDTAKAANPTTQQTPKPVPANVQIVRDTLLAAVARDGEAEVKALYDAEFGAGAFDKAMGR